MEQEKHTNRNLLPNELVFPTFNGPLGVGARCSEMERQSNEPATNYGFDWSDCKQGAINKSGGD